MKITLIILATLSLFSVSASAQSELTFKGYDCLSDCSDHKAGFVWAEENTITDISACTGNAQSFIQGCQAWVEENNLLTEQEDEFFTFPDEGVIVLE